MSDLFEGKGPQDVLHYFEEIARIPHGSGNTDKISGYIEDFAKKRGLSCTRDRIGNCIIRKEASAGYEKAPVLMMQGHMDMVCEKNAGVSLDMEKEPIHLILDPDGDTLHADGTTLGADDGIGVAMMLAVLADDTLPHPALECIFTVDEETGMDGAVALDCSDLKGRLLLNLDSEEEGMITAGCAGGAVISFTFPESLQERKRKKGAAARLTVQGLLGGHSGEMIGLGRANANALLGRVLYALNREFPLRVAKVCGGTKDNAITREAEALLLFPEDIRTEEVEARARTLSEEIRREYRETDPDIEIGITFEGERKETVFTRHTAAGLIEFLACFPQGVMEYTPQDRTAPQTSLNLGVLQTEEHGVTAVFLVRSSINSQKEAVCGRLFALGEAVGATVKQLSAYPAWEFVPASAFRDRCAALYEQHTGKKARVLVIHGGLECGLLSDKIPGLDAVSIGPDIHDIHTPKEHISLRSIARTYEYVRKILSSVDETMSGGGEA